MNTSVCDKHHKHICTHSTTAQYALSVYNKHQKHIKLHIMHSIRSLKNTDDWYYYASKMMIDIFTYTCDTFRFMVLPQVFIYAERHARSEAWQVGFGANKDPMHALRIAHLYRESLIAPCMHYA